MTGIWIWLLSGCSENQSPYAPYLVEAEANCVPNIDEILDVEEFPIVDVIAEYAVNQNVSLDFVAGQTDDGTTVWDFREDMGGETIAFQAHRMQDLNEPWFADSFPTAEWVLPNDIEGRLWNVVRKDEDALWMLGLVSVEEEPSEGQTLLVYDNPVALLRFPIEVGQSFTSVTAISQGQSNGLPFVGTHQYEVAVVSEGALWLNHFAFDQVLRINTIFTMEPNVGNALKVRQSSFMTECFGELVRLESAIGAADFAFEEIEQIRVLRLE